MSARAIGVLFAGAAITAYAASACARSAQVTTAAAAHPTPAGALTVRERLLASPRRGEWAMIKTGPNDSVRAWIVYAERSAKAPVVLVVHEIFGLSSWVRGVADQLAANGYVAVAPDLLTGKVPLEGDTMPAGAATAAIRTLRADDVHRQLAAVAQYGMNLPAAQKKYGIVGYCWGGSTSFAHAVRSPAGLAGAVVYYGGSPDTNDLSRVKVPVLGLYAGDDQRVNATVPRTDTIMRRLGKPYEVHFFEGAGHGFLRQQDGRAGANQAASDKAWPLTISFFRRTLGS
jgi:carboxymethylenebutenolidase